MLSAVAVSCVDPGNGDVTTSNEPAGTTEAPTTTEAPEPEKVPEVADDVNLPKIDATTLELVKGRVGKARIIYAGSTYDTAVTFYKEQGTLLSGKIKIRYGATLPMIASNVVKNNADALEILIGPTDRPESDMALEFVNGTDGFVIKAIGKKLVINAFTDNALLAGVDYFCKNFVDNSQSAQDLIFSSANDYASEPTYSHPEYKLAGYSYKPYTIVVPENADYSVLRTARSVQHTLGSVVGVIPKVVYDNETGHAGDFEILIGMTNRTSAESKNVTNMEYVVAVRSAKLEITAGSVFAYEQVNAFIEGRLLKELNLAKFNAGEITRGDTVKSLERRGSYAVDKKEGEYRIVCHNVWGWNEDIAPGVWGFTKLHLNGASQRNLLMAEIYRDLDADVVALQEYTDRLLRVKDNYDISPYMEEYGYAQVYTSASIGNAKSATPIFYKADKFELLESDVVDLMVKYTGCGGDKYMTTAVLKNKENGEVFTVISLHADYRYDNANAANQAIYDGNRAGAYRDACVKGKLMQQKYDNCPVFICGDMNSISTHTPFAEFAKFNYVDVQKKALNTDNGNTAFDKPTWDAIRLIFDRDLSNTNLGTFDMDSIDHIMLNAPTNKVGLVRYDILTDISSASISDHMPHVIDFNIN